MRPPLTGVLVLSVAALAASGAVWWYNAGTPVRGEPGTVGGATPAVQPFTFHLRTAEPVEGPIAVNERLLWQHLHISSGLTFDYVPAGRPDQQCVAENIADDLSGIQRFNELRDLLGGLPRDVDCDAPCPSCAEVSLEWFLDQERHSAVLTDRCWNTHPELQALRTSVEGIVAAAYGRVICN